MSTEETCGHVGAMELWGVAKRVESVVHGPHYISSRSSCNGDNLVRAGCNACT